MKDTILNKNEPIPRQAVISNLHFRYMTSASGDTKTASSMKCYLYYISTEVFQRERDIQDPVKYLKSTFLRK